MVFSGKWKLTEADTYAKNTKGKKNISIQKVRYSRRNGKKRNVNVNVLFLSNIPQRGTQWAFKEREQKIGTNRILNNKI